ncbi:MAG: nuclear transport factor 2 family protein [Chryseobacterium sp.]|nr:MAG: nuclear transport factor 2 family protein [Chryseobacterium sp.]
MTLEILKIKDELRELIDAYASLGDEKKIAQMVGVFTPDASYKVYMNGAWVGSTDGRDNLEKEFSGHASVVKTYFTLNGQHTVKIDNNKATGVSFTQIKMIRESEGKDILSDYSVRYDDNYVFQDGKWFINERTAHFIVVETRTLG